MRSTLPLFALPGAGSINIPRPPLSVTGVVVSAVLHAVRFEVKALIWTLVFASEVQLSSLFVWNTYPAPAVTAYCASKRTGSGTSCEPFAFLSAKRPKRISLPLANAMPLPALAWPKRAGLLA